jgi:hypothetical protein
MGKAGLGRQTMEATIEDRRVDNPLTTYAQFRHEIETASPYAGVVKARVNMTTLVGGAHRFFGPERADGREARLEACRIFRNTYEASQIGGAKAVDPSVEPVDGGGVNPDAAFERGADARRRWDHIEDAMTRLEMKQLHFVIIGEWGPTPFARHFYAVRQANSRQISKGMVEFRKTVDKLSRALHLQKRGGGAENVRQFTSTSQYQIAGRGTVFATVADQDMPRDVTGLTGVTVLIDGKRMVVRAVERRLPSMPVGKGEPIGLLADPEQDS